MTPDTLAWIAGAVAGRRLVVDVAPDGLARTDGLTVLVPAGTPEDEVGRMVVLQAALLGAGSFDPAVLRRLSGRGVVPRYLLLEATRAVIALDDVVPRPVSRAVTHTWGGQLSTGTEESLARALAGEPLPVPPDWFGTIEVKALLGSGADLRGRDGGVETGETSKVVAGGDQAVDDEPDEDEDPEQEYTQESKLLRALTSPVATVSPIAKLLTGHMGKSHSKAEGAEGSEIAMSSVQAGDRSGSRLRRALTATAARRNRPGAPGVTYDEWDTYAGAYKEGFTRVVEFDGTVSDEPTVPSSTDHALRRDLVRVNRSLQRHRHQEHGDALDLDALVDLVVDRRTGSSGDDRIYSARLRTQPDLGVLVLLDMSGSTGQLRPDGTSVFEDQCQIALDLVAACEAVGHRVAIHAFNSEGEQAVRIYRVKTFDERFGQVARGRLAGLRPGGFTRTGAALRHATQLVHTWSGSHRRLVVLLSDGFPYDGPGYEGSYAEDDTRKALEEARGKGVAMACVNLAPAHEDNRLDRIFGDTAHVRVGTAEELPRHVHPLFASAVAAAS